MTMVSIVAKANVEIVDAIIAHDLPKPYAFDDDPATLNEMLMQAAEAFTADMIQLIESLSDRSRHAD